MSGVILAGRQVSMARREVVARIKEYREYCALSFRHPARTDAGCRAEAARSGDLISAIWTAWQAYREAQSVQSGLAYRDGARQQNPVVMGIVRQYLGLHLDFALSDMIFAIRPLVPGLSEQSIRVYLLRAVSEGLAVKTGWGEYRSLCV